MKKMFIATMAFWIYQGNAATVDAPAECKNLALMQAQLLGTVFSDGRMGNAPYNPSKLTVRTKNGLTIGLIEDLGSDEGTPGDPSCFNQVPNAGGGFDCARITVNSGTQPVAKVVVTMGSRGGCLINSSTAIQNY